MRLFENEKKASKKRYKKGAKLLKKKESATITARKNISLKSIDCPKLTMRRPTILKRNKNERFKENLN
jgi:hypothetical protein